MLNPNIPAASSHTTTEQYIGALDTGSNAIRYAVYRLNGNLNPVQIYQKRYPVRLGAGTFSDGRLDAADMNSAVAAFRNIASHAEPRNLVALLAVATSAVRDAANGREFLGRVFTETGIEIKVITGEEEAALVAEGIQISESLDRERLIIDVGGGSTEIICHHPVNGIVWCKSLSLGAVRLAQSLGMPALYNAEQIMQLRYRVKAVLNDALSDECVIQDGACGLSVGGTGRALAMAIKASQSGAESGRIQLADGVQAINVMAVCEVEEFPRRFDIEVSRAAIMVPGSIILTEVMRAFGLNDIHVSESSVREGLVRRYVRENMLG